MDLHDEQLKSFFEGGRHIRPSENFREQSLGMILSRPQKQSSLLETIRREFFENMQFSLALGLAAVFVFIALGSLSSWGSFIPGNAARTNQELLSEAAALEFSIELAQAEYFTESADTIAIVVESLKNQDAHNRALDVLLEEQTF